MVPTMMRKREDVGQLLEGDGFALHLAPDGIGALLPARHLRLDALRPQLGGQVLLDLVDELLVFRGKLVQVTLDGLVGLRVEVLERQLLQLLAHFLDAHAAGERRVDVEGLLGDAPALVRRHELQGAHVVQAVGELDQQHPHVVGNGEQQLAEILALGRALRHEVEPLDLGQAVDEGADLGPEGLVDLLQGRLGILHRIVEHRRGNGRVVELEVREDGRDFQGMAEEQVAGGTLLVAMSHHGIHVRPVEKRLVGRGVVALDPLDEFILAHHAAAISLGPVYLAEVTKLLKILYNVFRPQAEYLATWHPCGALVKRANKKARL